MWDPFMHDWEVLKERGELERKLEEDKNATVSIEISVDTFLKFAKSADHSSHDPINCFVDKRGVSKHINEFLSNAIKKTNKKEASGRSKVLSKSK